MMKTRYLAFIAPSSCIHHKNMQTNNSENKKFLTLESLVDYNRKTLFPFLEETLVTKKEFNEFKNDSLANQDAILKKLDTLLAEKTVREYQEKKEKKMWVIIIRALKEHRILSPEELKEIAQLEIF